MKELKDKVIEKISESIQKQGFKLVKSKGWYLRKRADITEKFWIVFYDTPTGYRVTPTVGIRLENVEKIYHLSSCFEKKHQKNTQTIESELWRWQDDNIDYQYSLESIGDVDRIVKKLIICFEGICQEFYQKYSSLNEIDVLLNSNPEENSPFQLLDHSRCSHGIIVARLNGRDNFDEIASIYEKRMKFVNGGFYYKWFGPLLDIVKKHKTDLESN